MFKPLALLAIPLVTLAACQTTSPADAPAVFARICQAEPAVHAAFVVLAPVAHVSADAIAKELTAHNIIARTCANPPTDVATVIKAVEDAWNIILDNQTSAAKAVK